MLLYDINFVQNISTWYICFNYFFGQQYAISKKRYTWDKYILWIPTYVCMLTQKIYQMKIMRYKIMNRVHLFPCFQHVYLFDSYGYWGYHDKYLFCLPLFVENYINKRLFLDWKKFLRNICVYNFRRDLFFGKTRTVYCKVVVNHYYGIGVFHAAIYMCMYFFLSFVRNIKMNGVLFSLYTYTVNCKMFQFFNSFFTFMFTQTHVRFLALNMNFF